MEVGTWEHKIGEVGSLEGGREGEDDNEVEKQDNKVT